MVSRQHEHHLEELAGVVRETTTEPEEGHDTADTDLLSEHVGDGHASVQKLLATVVGDGGDEGGGLSDEAELLRPGVVDGDLGHDGLRLRNDGSVLDELVVQRLEHAGHLLKGLGDEEASFSHHLVLHRRSLELGVGE